MMTLPFFGALAATVFAWRGQRRLAVIFWAGALTVALVLFLLHATDPLDLDF